MQPADGLPEDLAALPRQVLDADGLDILELALVGAVTPDVALAALAAHPGAEGLAFTDAENTPLAVVRPGPDGVPEITAVRPFAHATGAQWDPALRRTPADVRAVLGAALSWTFGARALVADDVPSHDDLATLARWRTEGPAFLLAILVGRRSDGRRRVPPAGIVRAWRTELAALPDCGAAVVPVVVPWPATAAAAGLEPGAVLAAYGATSTARLDAGQPVAERASTAGRDGAPEPEIRQRYPEASAAEILRARRPGSNRGAVVFLTGLSGSGKSTIARALADALEEFDARRVTLLDGDEVRQHLSRGLGFDAASRAINIDRMGFVASLVAQHGGIAIAAPIAPFDAGRKAARAMAAPHGAFLLVHVATPLDVCEARDRKGLYARARAGEVPEFTGISSPYEPPADAEVTIDTTTTAVGAAVAAILGALDRLEATADGVG